MIDNLVKNHKCPMCQSDITDENIDIIGAAGTTLNIDVECPRCQKHTMIRAEIAQIDARTFWVWKAGAENFKEYFDNFKKSLLTKNNRRINSGETDEIKNEDIIKDTEIIHLSKSLKSKKISVSDLLWEEK